VFAEIFRVEDKLYRFRNFPQIHRNFLDQSENNYRELVIRANRVIFRNGITQLQVPDSVPIYAITVANSVCNGKSGGQGFI
jgi:hypothetical protein